MKQATAALMMAVSAAAHGLAATPAVKAEKKVLTQGVYAATVAALVCEACPAEVAKTLKAFPGLEAVSLSREKSTVRFAVKKGAAVRTEKLQSALRAASERMGMGADYGLRDLKRVGP